jgi:hypothetical protein
LEVDRGTAAIRGKLGRAGVLDEHIADSTLTAVQPTAADSPLPAFEPPDVVYPYPQLLVRPRREAAAAARRYRR